MFFFFSSRRRHTSSYGDWSSDVCSSDLGETISVGTPVVDPFGLGTRVPTLIVSPYAKRGVVAHGLYDHRSEERRVGKSVDRGGRSMMRRKKRGIGRTRWEQRRKYK